MPLTVNITCHVCDGRRLCEACRAAGRTLSSAGYRVEHSTRYAALRAAASGTYGFDACVVPVGSGERSLADAAVALFSGRRLSIVADDPSMLGPQTTAAASIVPRAEYATGRIDLGWLTRTAPSPVPGAEPATAAMPRPDTEALAADRNVATRRLKRVADQARTSIAQAGLAEMPTLDLFSVLEDEIAWARASGGAFAIVLVHLHGISSTSADDPEAAERRLRQAREAIAKGVRGSDVIAGRGDDFLVVLADADVAGAKHGSARVARALRAASLRDKAKMKGKRARGFAAWSIGAAAYPADGASRDVLLARATAAFKPIE